MNDLAPNDFADLEFVLEIVHAVLPAAWQSVGARPWQPPATGLAGFGAGLAALEGRSRSQRQQGHEAGNFKAGSFEVSHRARILSRT